MAAAKRPRGMATSKHTTFFYELSSISHKKEMSVGGCCWAREGSRVLAASCLRVKRDFIKSVRFTEASCGNVNAN